MCARRWPTTLGLAGVVASVLLVSPPVWASGLPVRVDTLRVEPTRSFVCLERHFVIHSTLEIREDGRLLVEDVDYVLEADAGCFTLLVPDTAGYGRILVARYESLPLALAGVYRLEEDPHRRKAGVAPVSQPQPERNLEFTEEEETRGLSISGSKTFGIEVGNRRDLKLQQSLDLRLTGQVSRDVSLLAILSDQDIPFQPEGNTAELADLDRVLVQLDSPRAGAGLGDVSLVAGGTAFLNVQRELEGFTARAELSELRGRGALASAKGEFVSREFFGEDGKQGPYRLTDRAGNPDIVVVAGSERVWVDGRPLTRGQEEDYVFDYSLGQITFTSRQIITANSEITVDYQYATGRYRRQVGYGEAAGDVGPLTVRASFLTEGDDPENPFSGALTDEERRQLEAVGDSAEVEGGTRYVGPGLGDYELVVDSVTGEKIFVFVEGTGDYAVNFINVGDGQGEYESFPAPGQTRMVYSFVGEGNGRFVPSRDLPAPQASQVADLRMDLAGERGRLTVEGAISDLDGNVLSTLHDGDNRGGAFLAEGELGKVSLGAMHVTPRFRWRRVEETFRSPARIRQGFYARDWNLTGLEEIQGEDLREAALEIRIWDRLRWSAEAGRLALADTFLAVRQRQTLGWKDRWVNADAHWLTTRDEVLGDPGNLNRRSGQVQLVRFPVRPRVAALHEIRQRAGTGDGERHRDLEVGLGFPLGSAIRVEVGAGRRLDDSLRVDRAWTLERDTRRAFGELETRGRNLNLLLRYDARRVTSPGSGGERRDTGRLDVRHRAVRGAWTALVTANLGTVGLSRRTKTIVPADSAGYYDEFGNYVGPGGGYDVQYGAPGDEILTSSVNLSTRLRWGTPARDISVPGLFRAVAWEGFANLTEASELPLVTPRYFFSPGSYLNRGSTLDGRLNQRQTLDLFPTHRVLGVRFQQEARRILTTSPQGNGDKLVESREEDTFGAAVRSNPGPGWDAEIEGELGSRREEVYPGQGQGFVQKTGLRTATIRAGKRFPIARGQGRLSNEVSYSTERGEDREALAWVVRPRLQWSRGGWGRLDVRYSLTDVVSRSGFVAIRGPGAPSHTEGWRLDVITELRIHKGIVVSGTMTVDHPQGLIPVTRGRMEVRGTF